MFKDFFLKARKKRLADHESKIEPKKQDVVVPTSADARDGKPINEEKSCITETAMHPLPDSLYWTIRGDFTSRIRTVADLQDTSVLNLSTAAVAALLTLLGTDVLDFATRSIFGILIPLILFTLSLCTVLVSIYTAKKSFEFAVLVEDILKETIHWEGPSAEQMHRKRLRFERVAAVSDWVSVLLCVLGVLSVVPLVGIALYFR